MTKNYPPEFIKIIDGLLENEAPLFWKALQQEPPRIGLRANSLKLGLGELQEILPAAAQTLPWSECGVVLPDSAGLGKHPYHAAGLFYLQEPSAMVPVAVLDPRPGERVLDLCAAPGGKTTQIQSRLGNRGLLIANDSNPRRVQALSRNIERWGARSAPVICETPRRISEHLESFFDRVLVDAPCSGEGTFRSDPGEIKKWSLEFSLRCCRIQDEILWFAAKMVRPGGVLVYSTCTFNQDENEGTISRFLEKNPDFYLEPIDPAAGYAGGIQIPGGQALDLSGMVRIWPHRAPGEGHFAARLRKSSSSSYQPNHPVQDYPLPDPDLLDLYASFFERNLKETPRTADILPGSDGLHTLGNRLYWIPADSPSLEGLNVRHWGWWLGSYQSQRFLPSPALASALGPDDAQIVLEFSIEDPRLAAYQRGSPLAEPGLEERPGKWALITCDGYSLGWGMVQRGRVKSYFPRWLRNQ